VNGTVTALRPSTRSVQVTSWSPDERQEALEELARDLLVGLESPSDRRVRAEVACFASPIWTPAEAWKRWGDYLSEVRRWLNHDASDPDYRDLPGFYKEDTAAALADLVRGTDTYRGTR